jgi:hypothetical protein
MGEHKWTRQFFGSTYGAVVHTRPDKALFVMKRLAPSLFLVASAATAADFAAQDGATISYEEVPFQARSHTVRYCKNETLCACQVDGAWPLGTAPCQVPETQLAALQVRVAGKAYQLDTSRMFNPGINPAHPEKQFKVSCKGKACTVKASFSDGAGAYVAEWGLQEGKARRTLLSSDEEIVDKVMTEIRE